MKNNAKIQKKTKKRYFLGIDDLGPCSENTRTRLAVLMRRHQAVISALSHLR